jgi:hypothetical protein
MHLCDLDFFFGVSGFLYYQLMDFYSCSCFDCDFSQVDCEKDFALVGSLAVRENMMLSEIVKASLSSPHPPPPS